MKTTILSIGFTLGPPRTVYWTAAMQTDDGSNPRAAGGDLAPAHFVGPIMLCADLPVDANGKPIVDADRAKTAAMLRAATTPAEVRAAVDADVLRMVAHVEAMAAADVAAQAPLDAKAHDALVEGMNLMTVVEMTAASAMVAADAGVAAVAPKEG